MTSEAKHSPEGITTATKERWITAQNAEKTLWMSEGQFWSSDRNESHSEGFGNYASIRGKTFIQALEVGCGPFTNTRLIAKECTISQCTLLDPLIEEYLNHPCCSYTNKKLFLGDLDPLSIFPTLTRKISKLNPNLGKLAHYLFQRIRGGEYAKVKRLIPSPLEDAILTETFDLLIMINVIEHCYSFEKLCNAILTATKKGSVFIFNDRLYTLDEIQSDLVREFDPYHPLRVEKSVVLKFLKDNFKELYSKNRTDRFKSEDKDFEYEVIYFIGER